MESLIQRQVALQEKFEREKIGKGKDDPALNAFIIFDDVISDRVAMQWCKEINRFFVQGRHLKIAVFITTQHVKGLGPMLRGNCDLVVIQPMFSQDAREELAKLYAGFIPDKKIFNQFMDEVVVSEELPDSTPQDPKLKVRTMVCRDWINVPNVTMKFMWCEADNPDDSEPGWRLCHPEYWKQHDNQLPSGPGAKRPRVRDLVDELDDYQALQSFRF